MQHQAWIWTKSCDAFLLISLYTLILFSFYSDPDASAPGALSICLSLTHTESLMFHQLHSNVLYEQVKTVHLLWFELIYWWCMWDWAPLLNVLPDTSVSLIMLCLVRRGSVSAAVPEKGRHQQTERKTKMRTNRIIPSLTVHSWWTRTSRERRETKGHM